MKRQLAICTTLLAGLSVVSSQATAALIGFEAEGGTLGSGITVGVDATGALGGEYIDVDSNTTSVTPNSTATYTADIPSGTYDLYLRFYVGVDGASDDSVFVPSDFGVAPSLVVNQLDVFNSGFYTDVNGVEINGSAAMPAFNENYYWINVSAAVNNVVGNGAALTTYMTSGGVETFQIATRESGLRIDALALGTAGMSFTEADLNAAVIPEPGALALGLMATLAAMPRLRMK